MVDVVVREQDELQVLDLHSLPAERELERLDRRLPARAGIDERERVAPEEVRVDVADRGRNRKAKLDRRGAQLRHR